MTEKFGHEPSLETRKYIENFRQLGIIKEVISACGLEVCNYPTAIISEQFKERSTFPIANDGAQGIRVTPNRDGSLTVSFTNGFEDPKNEKRIEVTDALRKKGIDVV